MQPTMWYGTLLVPAPPHLPGVLSAELDVLYPCRRSPLVQPVDPAGVLDADQAGDPLGVVLGPGPVVQP
ncbi:MAG: hypothetical protein JWQ95_3746 [Sphaerisporangium sp.]|nr:hypothetical protein [Sphaerisporangium sp.]